MPSHKRNMGITAKSCKRLVAPLTERAGILEAQAVPGDLGANDRHVAQSYRTVIADLERVIAQSRRRSLAAARS